MTNKPLLLNRRALPLEATSSPAHKKVCAASDGSGLWLKIKLLPPPPLPPPTTKLRLRIKRPVLPSTANKTRLGMNTASSYLPKDSDAKPLGEDAHFLLQERQTIGEANGVGSWAKKGIDASIYALELMDHAFSSAVSLEPSTAGSSTACIVTLRREDNKLCYANVGNSGFLVFRNKKLLFRSPTQQHRFNCPYRLKNGGKARVYEGEVAVEGGDVVVAGSDGLLDNLFVEEMERILEDTVEGRRRQGEEEVLPEHISWNLACAALLNSQNPGYRSPFQCETEKAGRTLHNGGKNDGITVIVAMIKGAR
ncbi:hypothetical protein Tsubulata_020066 [Turnera subulata]|uniref:Protein phosphatase n=1 Tax=Turnera subulata TaxID=218843 RepID=A0A9Q0GFF7_9ROSI|nr:hypothetical protein Tsubulata_020066 [Turnera subulata]